MKHRLTRPNIKTWQLILLLLPSIFLAISFLRLDHIRMTELRSAVLDADELGDDVLLEESLSSLKNFSTSHAIINITEENGKNVISFGTGPFYLEHSYRLAAEAALEEAESKLTKVENPYGNIYLLASEACKPQGIANGWNWTSPEYIACMTSEIGKYPASAEIVDTLSAKIPSTELYRREYSSPIWAPTFGGFVTLFCLILIVVIFTRFIIWIVFRLSLLFLK